MRTLQQILIDANAYLDLDATMPTGSELTVRANYANQSVWDATAYAQFDELTTVAVVATSTLASISLASNFREFMVEPMLLGEDGRYTEYPEIRVTEKFKKESSDKYCYVLGNPATGYTAVFNNLTAGATLSLVFQRYPSGLATLTDICELPDPTYVTSKLESYVLQSRGDERFPAKEGESQQKLQNMIGRESKQPGGGVNQVRRTGTAAYSIGS